MNTSFILSFPGKEKNVNSYLPRQRTQHCREDLVQSHNSKTVFALNRAAARTGCFEEKVKWPDSAIIVSNFLELKGKNFT